MAHVQRSLFSGTPYVRCTMCGYKGKGKYYCPGSILIELILRLTIVLGLIYTIWRHSNNGYICKQCGNHNVIKITKKEAETTDPEKEGDKYDQLEKLMLLKEKGAITEEEFQIEKQHIMS